MKIRRIPYQIPVIIVCLGNIGLRLPLFWRALRLPVNNFFTRIQWRFTVIHLFYQLCNHIQYPLPQQLGHSIPVATTTGSLNTRCHNNWVTQYSLPQQLGQSLSHLYSRIFTRCQQQLGSSSILSPTFSSSLLTTTGPRVITLLCILSTLPFNH